MGPSRRTTLDEAALAGWRTLGLAGIEVDHQDHDAAARGTLRAIARNLDLVATGSSDHHGTGKVDHDLGCNTTAPERVRPAARARAGPSAAPQRRGAAPALVGGS